MILTYTLSQDPFASRSVRTAGRRALRKAGRRAHRDLSREASKRVRARKRLKVKEVNKALHKTSTKGAAPSWTIGADARPVALSKYPHRQIRAGVSVAVNRGKRTVVRGAFVATMQSGHVGVFRRRGATRLPIRELLGSRPADALLHAGEAEGIADRGRVTLVRDFDALFPLELAK